MVKRGRVLAEIKNQGSKIGSRVSSVGTQGLRVEQWESSERGRKR
jgi:hypothetical protein